VRFLAILGAYLQALHVILGHENKLAIPLWSSLPIIAMVDFEFQTKWIRRKYLARQGITYPSQLPTIGISSWILYYHESLADIKVIVKGRKDALIAAAKLRMADYVDATETDMTERKKNRRRPTPNTRQLVEAANHGPEPGLMGNSETGSEAPFTDSEGSVKSESEPTASESSATSDSVSEPAASDRPPTPTDNPNTLSELEVRRRAERPGVRKPTAHVRTWFQANGLPINKGGIIRTDDLRFYLHAQWWASEHGYTLPEDSAWPPEVLAELNSQRKEA